ncbi:N-acetylneuraminate 7-O(or 9-O)-acetyltransferase [Aureococcus anophagefferens]|nr:N-acetylneuraminate 7-O(or 9-O)-acetyltransferase [Aureococcus anophagefferens]
MPPASTLLLLACTANALHVLLLAPSPDQAAHSLRSLEYATTRLDVTIVAPRADVARVEAAAAASLGRAAVVAAENADVAALVAAHRARDADAASAVVDGDAGGPVPARRWASPLAAPRRGVAAGGATLETFAARLEAHCAGRPFHVAPDPDAAVAVRAGAGPAAPSRRRLADAHNKPTNPALVDTYYEDPLKDVRSTARASLALTLGFAGTGENVEAYNGADVSRAEAFCLLAATPHVAFVGDSVTRFHYFIFNEWLATGRVDTRLKKLEDSKWADGEGSAHYDEASRWYDPDWSESSTHRQHFIKTHPVPDDARALCGDDLVDDAITTQFWFMLDWKTIEPFARPLFEDTVAPWADLTLDDYATLLLDRVPAAYLRTSPCCGEYTTETCVDDDEDRDSRRVEAVKGVDHYNFLAGKFVSKKSGPPLPLLDVHGFSNQWNVYARTQDGRHPVAPLYHIWTQLLLSAFAVDGRVFPARADGTRRSDAYKAGATRAPAPRPTSAPPTSRGGAAPRAARRAARDAAPTDGAAADGAAGGAAAKSKPAFVDDDGAGGVGYGGGASEILGGHGVREAFPGGCASDKAVDARAWRDALNTFKAGLGAAFSGGRGVCVLAPGARLIALALAFTPEVELPEIRGKRRPAGAARARRRRAAALELAAWVFVAAFCDAVAPSAVLPAGSRLLGENPDLWWFAMALLAVVCFAPPMVRSIQNDAADPALFFNRAQCNEWKGWMQVAFVAYHYANAQGVYVPIRWFVSAYVWLTGFGKARYFWKTSDFSGARFLKMVWRINCFAAPLSLATGTHWIAYYVVALHTVHFALCFAAFGLASACRRCLPGGAGRAPRRGRGAARADGGAPRRGGAVYGAMRALACAGGAVALGAAAVAPSASPRTCSRCEPPPPPAYAAVAVTEADDGDGEAPGSPGPPAREMVRKTRGTCSLTSDSVEAAFDIPPAGC